MSNNQRVTTKRDVETELPDSLVGYPQITAALQQQMELERLSEGGHFLETMSPHSIQQL